MNFLDKLTKKHIFIALFIFIAIVLLFTIKYISDNMLLQPHGTLNINSAPFDITMKYQNKTKQIHAENAEVPVPVGDYDITFSANGFADHTEKVSVEDKGTYKLAFQLDPQTDEAKKEIEDNSLKYDKVYQDIYTLEKEEYFNKHPDYADLAGNFPYRGRGYVTLTCSAYRQETLDKDGIGVCIDIAEEDQADKQLTQGAINDVLALMSNYDIPYDLMVNSSIYPTQEEIDQNIVYDCSEERNVPFCYDYTKNKEEAHLDHL